jgi:hypothetical protein
MGETGCAGEQGQSSHVVHYFDTSIDSISADPGNYQTLKLFFVPAGTLTSTSAIRLLAFSHSSTAGETGFRIRVEDSAFNNLNVEVAADYEAHKFGATLFKDSTTNGVHLFANDVCCSVPGYGFSSTVSVARDIFVFYEARVETTGQQWTSDFLVAELITDFA